MSSTNSQSQQQADMTPSTSPPVQDRTKMIEQFVKELVVDRDFKLDESGNIVMIRQLHVSKCTVPLLRQICVRFKVSGYKNQSKECTLGLLKNLVARESLRNSIYDESASCYSDSSSQEEEAAGVPEPRPPMMNKKSSAAAPDGNKASTQLLLSPGEGQSSVGSTTSDHEKNTPENNDTSLEEYHDAEQEELRSCSNDEDYSRASSLDISSHKKRKATRNMSSSDHDNNMKKKKKNSADLSFDTRKKRNTTRPNKKAKGTAPNAVTCINTYFRVINVYMCQRNRTLVMDLGRPPTKANLDSRTSPHRHVYEALLSQYLDDGNDDAAMFAYPDHVFWTLTGVRLDIAFSDFDTGLTANDIGSILEYINHHYQVAYRRNKQSGSHSDFENFVGTRYYLFYYHLWLNEAPHLLNFAVAELPSDVFRETCHGRNDGGATDNDDDDDNSSGNNNQSASATKKTKAKQGQKKTITKKAQKKDDDDTSNAAHNKQLGDALIAFHQAQSEKMKSNRESAAPRRERDLLEVFSEYKSRLKETRLELDAVKKSAATTYDSDDSEIINLKREIELCKKKRDEIFALLSESDLK